MRGEVNPKNNNIYGVDGGKGTSDKDGERASKETEGNEE